MFLPHDANESFSKCLDEQKKPEGCSKSVASFLMIGNKSSNEAINN